MAGYTLNHYVPEVRERIEAKINRQKEMLGYQLKKMREFHGFSQEELADLTGVSTKTIRQMEKGEVQHLEPFIIIMDELGLVLSTVLK